MRLHKLSSMILAAVVVLTVGDAWGVVQYTVTDLGTHGGTDSHATAINNSGQVVGYFNGTDGQNHAFLYSGGSMQDLGTLGGESSVAYGINDSGQVVGGAKTSGNGSQYYNAFRTAANSPINTTTDNIETIYYSMSYATAINDSGQVVGYGSKPAGSAFRTAANSPINHATDDLGTLGGVSSHASAINVSGQVVGWSSITDNAASHAFLYSGVTMTDLGTLGGTDSGAADINDSGQVVGWSYTTNSGYNSARAFLYCNGTMTDLGTLGGMSSAYGINNSGQVVGWSNPTNTTNSGDGHAFLYSGGPIEDLNNLIAPDSGWTLVDAWAINDLGQIIGDGIIGGQTHAFLLAPVPEPSTFILLAAGAIGFLGWAWRRRWKLHKLSSMILAGAVLCCAVVAQGAVTIETVPVGNAGNIGELSGASVPGGSGADRVCGAVSYNYNIGKYEVTAGQYTEFLNAVADTDAYGLYSTGMGGGRGCHIVRAGSSGSYTYSVTTNYANRPVNYVSWGDAARFANWLHNGQPTGVQGLSTTEDGAYYLNGATTNDALLAVSREADWKWAITSEDEWFKAAYHKNDGATGNYFLYPTTSDSVPSHVLGNPTDPGNNATFWDGDYTIGSPYWRTEVGAHENSDSPYGTFDQGGNVSEWNESVVFGLARGVRGGNWEYGPALLAASVRTYEYPSGGVGVYFGFRVASVPEPGSLIMLAVAAIGLFAWRRRTLHNLRSMMLAAMVVLAAGSAQADVFNLGGTRNPITGVWTGRASLETVPVGNRNNTADTAAHSHNPAGQGAVSYNYNIGKYEVTAGQYTAFLNAVADTDAYGLYNPKMSQLYNDGCMILQTGLSGSYTYSVAADYQNRPVNWVSWGDSARFANWLHNGQPTGVQGLSTTENGAYNLNGATTDAQLMAVTRQTDWKWAITSEDEWFKAAYHKNDGATGNYFSYPTSSDSVPSNVLGNPTDPGNNATFMGSNLTIPYAFNHTTEVGAHENSDSPYGTFDQGGNIWEWNDSAITGTQRGLRGGFWLTHSEALAPWIRDKGTPAGESSYTGFRVSSVPEPGSLILIVSGAIAAWAWRRRRRA